MSTTPGALQSTSTWGEYNNLKFIISQELMKMRTADLVRVDACTNDGELSPVGFVDVTVLTNQVDGSNPPNATPHITIYGLPYLRIQGGASGIIIDPQVGDIGAAVFASRDISKVKSTKAQANPGSARRYDFADGMYLGGMLNAAPTQYLRFSDAGIELVADTIQATDGSGPGVALVADPFYQWFLTVAIPALASHGIVFIPAPPITSVTTIFKAL